MPYVVQAVSTSGIVTWLTPPGVGGCRSMAPRSNADVLSTLVDAWGAIAQMPWVFSNAGQVLRRGDIRRIWSGACRRFPCREFQAEIPLAFLRVPERFVVAPFCFRCPVVQCLRMTA
jgi:hypothetical protein